jgi:uncharacterized membrane protein
MAEQPQRSVKQQPQPPTQGIVRQVVQHTAHSHSGPLPDPNTLAGYEKALPGAAERVFLMAEREQKHKHQCEASALKWAVISTLIGQFSGFIIGLIGVGGGIYLVFAGKPLAGFSTFFTSLASIIGVFFFLKREESSKGK